MDEIEPRPLLVRSTPWWGFLAVTVALLVLAVSATVYLVDISTGSSARPSGTPLSIGTASPTPLSEEPRVVLPGPVGGLPPTPPPAAVAAGPDRPDDEPANPPLVPSVPQVPGPQAPEPVAPPLPAPPPPPIPLPAPPPAPSPEGLVPFLVGTVDDVLDLALPPR